MSSVAPPRTQLRKPADTVSIPLYISGLIVTWCGIAAVNSVLGNDRFTSSTLTLATLGFIFSITCRWMGIDKRIINGIPLVLGAYLAIRYLRHTIDITSFVPPEALQSDMMIAVLLVWLSVVRAWLLTTDGSVVFTAITSIAMIGLVGAFNVNSDLIAFFVIFVMASLYLVMHQNYLTHRTWLPSQKSASDGTILKTHLLLCVLMGLGAMVIGTLLVVPVRMIGAGLSLGAAMKQFFAPNNNNDAAKIQVIDFSDDPSFPIGTGDGFSSDDTVVMVASPKDGQEHYWRGRTYDHYTRHGWTSNLGSPTYSDQASVVMVDDTPIASYKLRRFEETDGPIISRPVPAPVKGAKLAKAKATPSDEPLRTRFDVMMGRTSTVYSPIGTTEIWLRPRVQTQLEQTPDGYVGYDALQQKFSYITISNYRQPTLAELQSATMKGLPRSIKQRYVDDRGQDTLSQAEAVRIGETSLGIVNSLPNDRRAPFFKAEAIREWVATHNIYSLSVKPVPQDADAVSYFLFDSRKGYCDLFASSMALLCRYAGLPARVVTGFAPGTVNQKQAYDIRAKDKHAWVEVYFPNVGWYEFDPTIGSTVEAKKSDAQASMDHFREVYLAIVNFLNLNGPVPIMLFIVVVVCLTYVIKIEVVDRIREQMRLKSRQAVLNRSANESTTDEEVASSARHIAQDRYRRLSHALVAMGMSARGFRTPAAYAQAAHRQLPDRYSAGDKIPLADVLAAVDVLTEDIVIAAYAPDFEVLVLAATERYGRGADAADLLDKARAEHWKKSFTAGLSLSRKPKLAKGQ